MKPVQRDSHRRFTYRDPSQLRADIASLDLAIPWEDDPGLLLDPLRIGVHTVPNRLAIQPMEGFDAAPGGGPAELAFRRYRRYGAGGAGTIWCEATAVVEEGRSNPQQLWLHDGNVADFARLVEATRAATAGFSPRHEPLLILQLTHSGRWSRPGMDRRPVIVHHHRMIDALVGVDDSHPVVSDDALDRLQDAFVHTAGLAAAAGFDGVDVKACHGYLVSELLAGYTRNGKYGGSFENRSRFLLEVLGRIREAHPGLIATSRLNVFDGLPYPYGFGVRRDDADRHDPEEPLRLLRLLRGLGCALANISLGVPYTRPHLGRPYNRAVPGSPSAPEHPLVGIARFLQVTGGLQHALPDFPLIGSGYSWLRHFFPNVAAAVIRGGGASIVGVGRMGFAYPDFARDLVEHGAMDHRKSCVGCSGCSELMKAGERSGCVVRDADLYQLRKPAARSGGAQ